MSFFACALRSVLLGEQKRTHVRCLGNLLLGVSACCLRSRKEDPGHDVCVYVSSRGIPGDFLLGKSRLSFSVKVHACYFKCFKQNHATDAVVCLEVRVRGIQYIVVPPTFTPAMQYIYFSLNSVPDLFQYNYRW